MVVGSGMEREQKKQRLDLVVVERGLAETRARAQALIMGGAVSVDGSVVSRPASLVSPGAAVELVSQPVPYVSRGGLKLRHALDQFGLDVSGAVALDVGASTGGFTDVLVQAGARRVYAVDVGYGQLAWRLRNDPRVVVMERTNIRNVQSLPEMADIAVIDVSFISLHLVLPVVHTLLDERGQAVPLIKPQFEAGRERVGKKGVVRDPAVWREVLERILGYARNTGWTVRGLVRSPILGPAGNVEFLAHLSKETASEETDIGRLITETLDESLRPRSLR
ncbi:MAG TPA: TlyA family RNA methyltransferase [Candidatus Sulfotelmatobacter sp.]|nr:TlyA family RNA methyltransferase [Candidatus Sulfotelmatobacter sp.]